MRRVVRYGSAPSSTRKRAYKTRSAPLPEYREIPGFEGRYYATADGRIWSYSSQKFLNPGKPRRDGYLYVMPLLDGRSVNRAVHRLVCAAFHGAPVPGIEANHDDLDKTNNAASNLGWMTPRENTRHALANLPAETLARMREGFSRGARTVNRKKRALDDARLFEVRAALAAGRSHMSIAAKVGVSRQAIDHIANGTTYVD